MMLPFYILLHVVGCKPRVCKMTEKGELCFVRDLVCGGKKFWLSV